MNQPTSPPLRRRHRVLASPRARRLMQQLGVAPASVRGSGPGGRIVAEDVTLRVTAGARPDAGGISAMRRDIAEKTAKSFASVPHFYLRAEADVTELVKLRQELVPAIKRQAGVKLTLTDLLLAAMSWACADYPFANSIWRDDTIVTFPTVDLGLVVGLQDGLLIPVLRNAGNATLGELARQRIELTARAHAGRLSAAETQGAAMSLSNLGNSRVDEFAAVIAPGQSSMLSVGRAAPRPFVVQDQLAVRTTLCLCLAADHRVMDGAPAAKMLGRIVDLLENPDRLLCDPMVS